MALRVQADLRHRWGAWLALALLIGVFAGGVIAIAAGAVRTDSAYPRLVRMSDPPDDMLIASDPRFASIPPATLARLPEVKKLSTVTGYDVVRPAIVGLVAPTDDSVGGLRWRRKLLSGRLPDLTDPNGVTVSFLTAEDFHLHVGDRLPIVVQTRSAPTPETVKLHVVGIDAAPTEFPPRSGTGNETVWATPAFTAHHPELAGGTLIELWLRHGAADVPALRDEITRLSHGQPTESFSIDANSANTQRAIHLQSMALWILAGMLGLAALLITAQLLARQSTMEAEGYRELHALGMTTRQIWAVGMVRVVAIGVVAGTVGVILAALVSPVFPIGLAGIAEPHPGFELDVVTLLAGSVLTVLLIVAAAAWPNWRVATAATWASRRDDARMGRSRFAGLARTSGAPATMVTGIGFALERGRGRLAGPIRSTVAASVMGIAALSGALVFSSSLSNLMASPGLYGVRWSAVINSTAGEGRSLAPAQRLVTADPDVDAVSVGYTGVPLLSGTTPLGGMALDTVRGASLQPTVMSGRLPANDNEVALGTLDMKRLHVRLGDTIPLSVVGIDRARRYRVVGTAVFPSLADQLNLGHGALVTVGALKDTAGNQAPPPDTILVHFRPGTDQRAMVARLNQQVGKLSPDFNASVPWQPVDLVNFGRVRDLPILVGGLLAALAIGTLVHLLATSIRSRRRDLAILKVLGFVPRQVRRTIGWQANTIAVLALVAGIPLGLVIGRWLWLAFSDQLGVRTVTRVPWLAGVALVVAVLVAAQLVALASGLAARKVEHRLGSGGYGRPVRASRVLAVVAAVSAVALTHGAGAGAAPVAATCAQPYQPWFEATTYPTGPVVPDLGTSLLYTVRPPDTDGDGVADTIVDDTDPVGGVYQSLTITRGDGTITLLPGPGHSYIYLGGYSPQPGDLNGDGRDELIVGVDTMGEQYLLPGTVTPGTHDIASVAVSLHGLSNQSVPVGDQNGDHENDLAFLGVSGWSVYSGGGLLAPGPGGMVGPPTPLATYPGTNLSAATLVPGAAPTIITGHTLSATSVSLTVHESPPIELTATGVFTEYTGGVGRIGAYRRDGQTLITQEADSRDGASIAIWNLSDPCSRYGETPSTAPTTTGAPAASVPSASGDPTTAAAEPAALATSPVATPLAATATYTG